MTPKVLQKRGRIKRWFSLFLALAILLTGLSLPSDIFADPSTSRDVSALIKPELTLSQGGSILQETGATIDRHQPFYIEGSFKVPVRSDDSSLGDHQIIKKGDHAELVLATGVVSTSSDWIRLSYEQDGKTYKVGEARFVTEDVGGTQTIKFIVEFTGNSNKNITDDSGYENEDVFEDH